MNIKIGSFWSLRRMECDLNSYIYKLAFNEDLSSQPSNAEGKICDIKFPKVNENEGKEDEK